MRMDVIVTWKDGSTNCVCVKELRPVRKSQKITLGTKVKMYYHSKWYYGAVTVMEDKDGKLKYWPTDKSSACHSDSSDDIPLSHMSQMTNNYGPKSDENVTANVLKLKPLNDDKNLIVSNIFIELEREDHKTYENLNPCISVDSTLKNKSAEEKEITEKDLQLNPNDFTETMTKENEPDKNGNAQSELCSSMMSLSPKEITMNPPINLSDFSEPLRNTESITTTMNKRDNESDDFLLTHITDSLIKNLDVENITLSTQIVSESDMTQQHMDYEDAETCCPSDRSSPQLFGDLSDLNDPDYEPTKSRNAFKSKIAKTIKSAPDHYVPQTCEAVTCEQEVFSSCYRCSALLCWVHFEEEILPCTMHGFNQAHVSCDDITPQSCEEKGMTKQFAPDHHIPQTCEAVNCEQEVFSSCFRCSALICRAHFEKDDFSCMNHCPGKQSSPESVDDVIQEKTDLENAYFLEGSNREYEVTTEKKVSKRKSQKELRNSGQEYISRTKKVVPAKQLGPYCNVEHCKKMKRNCIEFSDEHRKQIHTGFYQLGNITNQREFIARHVIATTPKQRTTQDGSSRRTRSLHYYLINNIGKKVKVCRKFFLNTLSISEKMVRTCLDKIDSTTGFLDKEGRGGRREKQAQIDLALRSIVKEHIQRFPRVESHYCRANSSREYLHPDLSQKKMYRLLLEEQPQPEPSLTLYKTVFKEMRLTFHRPKKDQCSLCATFKNGSLEKKDKLREKYTMHAIEKETVRAYKKEDKKNATDDKSLRCSTFDLQQVIFLPVSNESAIFYKRRLSVYNLTIFDLVSRDCLCFVWPETESKRGSSEISTTLYIYLQECDASEDAVKSVNLYADGCAGQNKNSIVASALLHFINSSKNVQTISLKFFTPNHGQSEGDSAHSAISYALKKAGDVFVHTQLYPIINSARPSHPYTVHPLEYKDFKYYKQLSKNLKILTLRKDNETNKPVNWKEIVEIKVEKQNPTFIFFKTSHADTVYRSLSLKRTDTKYLSEEVQPRNQTRMKISREKYQDLMSLCSGETPIIRLEEFKKYYENLAHE